MDILNNVNSQLLSLVSAPGASPKSTENLGQKPENPALEFIKDKGLRNYLKHLEEEKIKALLEEAKQKALAKMGMDEEKLAQLKNKMPNKAFAELNNKIAELTQDIFEDLLKKNMARSLVEGQEEALSAEALAPKQPVTEKGKTFFINHLV